MKKPILVKSPNVANVLAALNTIQISMEGMNKAELKEVSLFINQVADAFDAGAPEELIVPHIDEVTLHMADLAGMVRDSYGLAQS